NATGSTPSSRKSSSCSFLSISSSSFLLINSRNLLRPSLLKELGTRNHAVAECSAFGFRPRHDRIEKVCAVRHVLAATHRGLEFTSHLVPHEANAKFVVGAVVYHTDVDHEFNLLD